MPKTIRLNACASRTEILKTFEKHSKYLIKAIRTERDYQIPKGYISWTKLSAIAGLALSTCGLEYARVDLFAFNHSHHLALWFAQDAPLYCITSSLFEALDNTDALHKPKVFTGWKPSLPSLLIALPKGILTSPTGEVDYLVICCSDPEHPEWELANWNQIQIPELFSKETHFEVATVDRAQTVWFSSTIVTPEGNLIYKQLNQGKHHNFRDRQFIERIRNLTINILLFLQYSSDFTNDSVDENEASDNEVVIKKPKGFTLVKSDRPSNVRRVRWLGKDYERKQGKHESLGGTHASPYYHRRKGHWRVLEAEDGKPWKNSKRIWIEPTEVNKFSK